MAAHDTATNLFFLSERGGFGIEVMEFEHGRGIDDFHLYTQMPASLLRFDGLATVTSFVWIFHFAQQGGAHYTREFWGIISGEW